MPSAEYYNRQADLFLTLSLASTNMEVIARFRKMAEDYRTLAQSMDSEGAAEPIRPGLDPAGLGKPAE